MGLEVLLCIGRVAVRNVSSYPGEAGDETCCSTKCVKLPGGSWRRDEQLVIFKPPKVSIYQFPTNGNSAGQELSNTCALPKASP